MTTKGSLANQQALKAASINLDDDDAPASPPTMHVPRTAPGQLMGLQGQLREANAELREANAEIARLRQGAQSGEALDLEIAQIYKVPGRQRILSVDERAELKANLANNELVHPIVVLPKNERGYELFSGYNRVEFYEELGRTHIRAVIQNFEADKANVLAFYTNLLSPDLPDYAKYVGLKGRQDETGFNLTQLAAESGLLLQTVSLLFNFQDLPEAARAVLDTKPHILGATAAAKLAALAKKGKADKVVEAVKMLEASTKESRFTEDQAVQFAKGITKTPQRAPNQAEVTVRQGAKHYCKITPRENQLSFKFEDAETSLYWAKKFEEYMREELKKAGE